MDQHGHHAHPAYAHQQPQGAWPTPPPAPPTPWPTPPVPARQSAWTPGVIVGLAGGGLVAVVMLLALLHLATRPEGPSAAEEALRARAEEISDALVAEDYETYCSQYLSDEALEEFDDCPTQVDENVVNPTGWTISHVSDETETVWFDDEYGFSYVAGFVETDEGWKLERVTEL